MTTKPADLPLFRDHTITWLMEHLPYAESTLIAFKYGGKPLSPRFRATCVKVLRKSEAQLFSTSVEFAQRNPATQETMP